MPSMANITVKNAAGTDVIYVAATASAGDKIPARWTQNALSGVQGFRPKLELMTSDNGQGNVRKADYVFTYPITYTDSVSGLPAQKAIIKITGTAMLPKDLTTDQWNEAFVQAGNLLVSTLVRSSIQEGYAPT